MSFVFYFFVVLIFLFFLVFSWSLRVSKGRTVTGSPPTIPEDLQLSHVEHLPQIRRALAPADYEFASKKIPRDALRRMQRERRHVTLTYLSALRAELDKLLRTARVIAALSPEVAAGQEWQRIVLTLSFLCRYRLIRIGVWAGYAPLAQICDLNNLLSGYSVRVEEALRKLGERAALLGEMASSPERRRIHPI